MAGGTPEGWYTASGYVAVQNSDGNTAQASTILRLGAGFSVTTILTDLVGDDGAALSATYVALTGAGALTASSAADPGTVAVRDDAGGFAAGYLVTPSVGSSDGELAMRSAGFPGVRIGNTGTEVTLGLFGVGPSIQPVVSASSPTLLADLLAALDSIGAIKLVA